MITRIVLAVPRGARLRRVPRPALAGTLAALIAAAPAALGAQVAAAAPAVAPVPVVRDTILTAPTLAPRKPLPAEKATAKVKKFSFIAYGDTRGRFDGKALQVEHGMVVESMLGTIRKAAATKDPIRFVVQSGDAVVNGGIATQLNVSYIPLINRLTQEGGVPYFLVVGNHDAAPSTNPLSTRRVDGLHNYFAANANLIPAEGSSRRLKGYSAYAFGYGNTFFIAFDSNVPNDTVQFAWVRGQLEKLDRKRYVNVAVFYHHPAFSSGPHGGPILEPQAASIRTTWMPLFRKHHVRLLLTGHEHLYEHWVERYADASGAHRMDQLVSGGGGAPLYTYKGEPDLTDYLKAFAPEQVTLEHLVRPAADTIGNPYHYVVVHVDGTHLSLQVIGVDRGRDYAPYKTSATSLDDPSRRP